MSLLGRVKDRLKRLADIRKAVEETDSPELVPANREYIRAMRRAARNKGPGYTRKMRKGRRAGH